MESKDLNKVEKIPVFKEHPLEVNKVYETKISSPSLQYFLIVEIKYRTINKKRNEYYVTGWYCDTSGKRIERYGYCTLDADRLKKERSVDHFKIVCVYCGSNND